MHNDKQEEEVAAFLRHFWMEQLKDFMKLATIEPPGERELCEPMTCRFGPDCTEAIMWHCNAFWTIMSEQEQAPYREAARELLERIGWHDH